MWGRSIMWDNHEKMSTSSGLLGSQELHKATSALTSVVVMFPGCNKVPAWSYLKSENVQKENVFAPSLWIQPLNEQHNSLRATSDCEASFFSPYCHCEFNSSILVDVFKSWIHQNQSDSPEIQCRGEIITAYSHNSETPAGYYRSATAETTPHSHTV